MQCGAHASVWRRVGHASPLGAQDQQGRSPLGMMLKPQALGSFLLDLANPGTCLPGTINILETFWRQIYLGEIVSFASNNISPRFPVTESEKLQNALALNAHLLLDSSSRADQHHAVKAGVDFLFCLVRQREPVKGQSGLRADFQICAVLASSSFLGRHRHLKSQLTVLLLKWCS